MSIFRTDEHVPFVTEGMKVIAIVGGGKGIVCEVVWACGYSAYVANKKKGFALVRHRVSLLLR